MKVSKPVLIFGIVVLLLAGYILFLYGKEKDSGTCSACPAGVRSDTTGAARTSATAAGATSSAAITGENISIRTRGKGRPTRGSTLYGEAGL